MLSHLGNPSQSLNLNVKGELKMEKITKFAVIAIATIAIAAITSGCNKANAADKAALAAEQQKAFDAAVEAAANKKVAALEAARMAKRPVVQIVLPAEYRNAEVLVTFGATTPQKVEQKKTDAAAKPTTAKPEAKK